MARAKPLRPTLSLPLPLPLSLPTIRQHAEAVGIQVIEVPESSLRYEELGPFMLVDMSTNIIVGSGLDVEALRRRFP